MPKKRCTPEEIIQHLRTVNVQTGKGLPVLDACRKLGSTEQTYYRGKKEYGGLHVDQAKRLKTLEQIAHWRRAYNHVRPHSALGYRPPAPEAQTITEHLVYIWKEVSCGQQ